MVLLEALVTLDQLNKSCEGDSFSERQRKWDEEKRKEKLEIQREKERFENRILEKEEKNIYTAGNISGLFKGIIQSAAWLGRANKMYEDFQDDKLLRKTGEEFKLACGKKSTLLGLGIGTYMIGSYVCEKALEGNYVPAGIMLATNLASIAYERRKNNSLEKQVK